MSSKIGLLLSSIFIVLFLLFGVDLVVLQAQYSDLESKATSVSYYIAKEKDTSLEFLSRLEEKYSISIVLENQNPPGFGDVINFNISKSYTPIVIHNGPLNIKISRSTVIGYYG